MILGSSIQFDMDENEHGESSSSSSRNRSDSIDTASLSSQNGETSSVETVLSTTRSELRSYLAGGVVAEGDHEVADRRLIRVLNRR